MSVKTYRFNAEEVRAAVAGGADIIDCEDPKQSLGMFAPRVITDICYAVRQTTSDAIPTSANIGIPLLVKGPDATKSVIRTAAEIEAKAAQEALGLAAAMDVGDGRSNIIKFEVDGLREEDVRPFVEAVKNAIRHSRQFQNHRVIASCLELDRAAWKARRANRDVISELLLVGEFYFDREGPIDLHDYSDIIDPHKLMDGRSEHSKVSLIEPSEPVSLGLPADADERLEFYVETLADAHVDGVMIDTPIQAKVAGIALVQDRRTARSTTNARPGTFTLRQLERFAATCAFRSVECWLAGSITPDHASELGRIMDVDVVMCRGAASAPIRSPSGPPKAGHRAAKRISAELVAELRRRLGQAA